MYIPVEDRKPDLAKAKQLLAEAGYPDGFKVEFFQMSGTTYDLDACQVVMGELKKIGIEATMNVVDRAPYFATMPKGNFQISVRGDSERLDPDDAYYLYLHSGEIDKNNWSRYSNKELDELLQKGRTTSKWEDRVPIYKKVVDIIKEDLPIYYVAKTIIAISYRDYVKGHDGGASTWFGYYGGGMRKVWLDR
jgi:peptide/nickel transport system substrate-binding protein